MSATTRRRLVALLGEPEPDLAELNLLVSAEARPELDLDAELGRIDALAEAARRDGVVAALRGSGVRGDSGSYDDPRNSFLDQVLERRRGLPIALATLTLAVAARVGVPLAGIGLPGHFVVADRSGPEPAYLDPFDWWAPLTREDCARLVTATAGMPWDDRFLRPVGPREIVARTLANLKGSYLRRQSLPDALWTVELALLVDPDDLGALRESAVLLGGVGRYADAEAAAAAYIARRPDAPDREAVQAHLAAVRDLRRRMN